MGRHAKPRHLNCDLPYRHEGPAVQTERGVCCGTCGMATGLRLVPAVTRA